MSGQIGSDPVEALTGSMRDFRELQGKDLIGRVGGFYEWQQLRRQHGLWPYSKATEQAPLAVCSARDDSGVRFSGLNFATQDYLGLSSDPEIKETAKAVIDEYGVHSAGSSALAGNTKYSLRLEQNDFRIPRSRSHRPLSYRLGRRLRRDQRAGAADRSRRDGRPCRTPACRKARTRRPPMFTCMVISIWIRLAGI